METGQDNGNWTTVPIGNTNNKIAVNYNRDTMIRNKQLWKTLALHDPTSFNEKHNQLKYIYEYISNRASDI